MICLLASSRNDESCLNDDSFLRQGYHGVVLRLVETVSAIDDRDLQRDIIHDVLHAASAVADKRGVGYAGPAGKAAVPWILGVNMTDGDRAARAASDDTPSHLQSKAVLHVFQAHFTSSRSKGSLYQSRDGECNTEM